MVKLLNNQFHQYFVTTGVIELKQIVIFDKSFSFLTESSEGTLFYKQRNKNDCSKVIDNAKARKGLSRVKVFQDLCLYENKPINIVIVPVGGLRLKGYIMIITDPSHNLKMLETNLGLPLRLNLTNNKNIFQSSVWPKEENKALISDYYLPNSFGVNVLSILTAQNISNLTSSLYKARLEVLVITGLVTILFFTVSVFVLRKYMLTPLNQLSYKLRHFKSSQPDVPKKIELIGTREIHELCEGFNYMADEQYKAQSSDQQKSQFLANMSHEIRTPLSAIIGFSETLYKNEKSKEGLASIERIIRNGKHLHQLINDILDLSKIEANQLTIENVKISLSDIIMEIESLMSEKARDKEIDFSVDYKFPLPEFITTDPTRLKQILINLCHNAIKFTEIGGVNLSVCFEEESNNMRFLIKDSGIGMSAEQISGLFKPFTQADSSTTRKYGGTGLGLHVSKLLSEKLGGNITLSSMPNIGSLFEVKINAGEISGEWLNSKENISLIQEKSIISIPKLAGNVLLAEDNIDIQELVSLYVGDTGASIEMVPNGKLAVEKALQNNFDIIFMDMQMPEMGGMEAIAELRKQKCTTPIVVLTANAMKEDQQKSEEVGANYFLTKPINQDEFYNTLAKHLHKSTKNVDGFSFKHKENDKIKRLVNVYTKRFPEMAARLELLIKDNDWDSLNLEIHKLKGSGSSFGFEDITKLCTNIELKIKNSDFNFAGELIYSLIELLRENVSRKAQK